MKPARVALFPFTGHQRVFSACAYTTPNEGAARRVSPDYTARLASQPSFMAVNNVPTTDALGSANFTARLYRGGAQRFSPKCFASGHKRLAIHPCCLFVQLRSILLHHEIIRRGVFGWKSHRMQLAL